MPFSTSTLKSIIRCNHRKERIVKATGTVVQDETAGLKRQNPVLCYAWLLGEQFDNTDHVHVPGNILPPSIFEDNGFLSYS